MSFNSYKGKKLSGILAFLVIVSISLAVLAALLPAASAYICDIDAYITSDPYNKTAEIVMGNTTNVTLHVEGVNETENVQVLYVLPPGVEYVENSSTEEPYMIIGNMLLWKIGDLTNKSWNVSFELYPDPEKIDFKNLTTIPLNELPYSRVIYGPSAGNVGHVTTGGTLQVGNLSFGFVVHAGPPADKFQFDDHDIGLHINPANSANSIIDDIYIVADHAYFWGNTTVNGTSYQFYVYVEDNANNAKDETADILNISITGPDGFEYSTNIVVDTGEVVIHKAESEEYFPFPALFANLNYVEGKLNISADGKYIGQPVNISGYAQLKVNKTGKANVRTIICVDGFPIRKNDSNVSSNYTEELNNIPVNTTWVPMSSGMHRISISTYVLNYKGEEVWNEDIQGPNEATTNDTIYIRRVRS